MSNFKQNLARLRSAPGEACVSDLDIDRLLLEDTDRTETASMRAQISACDHCRQRYEAIEADYQRFQARPAKIAFAPPDQRSTLLQLGAGLLATAAAVLLFVTSTPDPSPGAIRLKGGDRFDYTIVTASGRIRNDRTTARPGDELQWRFRASEDRYVAILSRGDDGRISVYFPEGEQTELISGGGETVLPTAVRLHGAERQQREQLYGFMCSKSVSIETLQAALREESSSFPSVCTIDRRPLLILEDL